MSATKPTLDARNVTYRLSLKRGAKVFFEDKDLHTIGKAFDRAWDRFLRTGMLTRHNLQDSRELIAKRILAKANEGDRDEWNLAFQAMRDFLERGRYEKAEGKP